MDQEKREKEGHGKWSDIPPGRGLRPGFERPRAILFLRPETGQEGREGEARREKNTSLTTIALGKRGETKAKTQRYSHPAAKEATRIHPPFLNSPAEKKGRPPIRKIHLQVQGEGTNAGGEGKSWGKHEEIFLLSYYRPTKGGAGSF